MALPFADQFGHDPQAWAFAVAKAFKQPLDTLLSRVAQRTGKKSVTIKDADPRTPGNQSANISLLPESGDGPAELLLRFCAAVVVAQEGNILLDEAARMTVNAPRGLDRAFDEDGNALPDALVDMNAIKALAPDAVSAGTDFRSLFGVDDALLIGLIPIVTALIGLAVVLIPIVVTLGGKAVTFIAGDKAHGVPGVFDPGGALGGPKPPPPPPPPPADALAAAGIPDLLPFLPGTETVHYVVIAILAVGVAVLLRKH